MVTIFFCDDNMDTVEKYSKLLQEVADKNNIRISISPFYNGESLLFHTSDTPDLPDILYLDILMGKLNGIETAKKLREVGCTAEIIFLTSSEDYVFDSFDTAPIHYLLKDDTSNEKFEDVFLRAVRLSSGKAAQKFVCKSGAVRKVIPTKEISHFDIWKGQITVHYGDQETFHLWMTMEEIEKQLAGKGFVRIHRSFVVNLAYIDSFQNRSILLSTGESVPVGITYEKDLNDAFLDYMSYHSANY